VTDLPSVRKPSAPRPRCWRSIRKPVRSRRPSRMISRCGSVAKRATPAVRMLGVHECMRVYASGINPPQCQQRKLRCRRAIAVQAKIVSMPQDPAISRSAKTIATAFSVMSTRAGNRASTAMGAATQDFNLCWRTAARRSSVERMRSCKNASRFLPRENIAPENFAALTEGVTVVQPMRQMAHHRRLPVAPRAGVEAHYARIFSRYRPCCLALSRGLARGVAGVTANDNPLRRFLRRR